MEDKGQKLFDKFMESSIDMAEALGIRPENDLSELEKNFLNALDEWFALDFNGSKVQ